MKDYSMNIEEQKDFICGYNITKDGKMIVKFATGKPWILPYNEENEQIVLKKMTVQVENSTEFRYILERKNKIQKQLLFGLCIISVISGILVKFGSGNLSNICLLLTPIIASAGLGIAGSYIKNNLVNYYLLDFIWSGKRGSNPRPSPWQGDALSTELFPREQYV